MRDDRIPVIGTIEGRIAYGKAIGFAALVLVVALLTIGAVKTAWADPDALWKIVHGECVPNAMQGGDPKPCLAVDLASGVEHGTALLKDRNGATQLLLLPTTRITGIEDPEILAPGATNYFEAAWRARSYLDALAHREPARDDVSLAINSASGRSQDQLHIHIDCLREDVEAALRAHAGDIGESWALFPVAFNRHRYWARRLSGTDLDVNPFALLADGLPGAKDRMGDETLVIAGATFPDGSPGFYLLADRTGSAPGDLGSGEELQDHARACRK